MDGERGQRERFSPLPRSVTTAEAKPTMLPRVGVEAPTPTLTLGGAWRGGGFPRVSARNFLEGPGGRGHWAGATSDSQSELFRSLLLGVPQALFYSSLRLCLSCLDLFLSVSVGMFVLPSRRVCSSHFSVLGRDISLAPDSACSLGNSPWC